MLNQTPERKAKLKYRSNKRKQIQLDYSLEDFERIKSFCQAKDIPVATWCKRVINEALDKQSE